MEVLPSLKLLPGPANRGREIRRLATWKATQEFPSESQTLPEFVAFPIASPNEHTMSYALPEYCCKRLPLPHLTHLLKHNIPIEIHAVPSEIMEKYHENFGYDWVERLVWRLHPLKKPFNFRRPEIILAREAATGITKAILTLIPGEDYMRHYAAMLAIAVHGISPQLNLADIRVVLRPSLTKSIMAWTGIDELASEIQPGDVVVLGFVEELLALIRRIIPSSRMLCRRRSAFYGLTRLELQPGIVFTLIGVTYSYWGNLGGVVAGHLWHRQPRAICYVAKQGTLTGPADIHRRIFSPSRFCVFDKGQPRWFSDRSTGCPVNPLANQSPYHDAGLHCSTPTIVEQNLALRTTLDKFNVKTLDNEVSQMAEALTHLHEENPSAHRVDFLPIMFVTDYIRKEEEINLHVRFDLTIRNETVVSHKERFFQRAAFLLLQTFGVINRPRAVVVGTGYGVKTIMPALQKLGVDIVGLSGGRNREKTQTIAKEHGILLTDRPLKDLVHDHGANLLFIASPHDHHASLVQEALDIGGIDIVCEKPLALDKSTMLHLAGEASKRSRVAAMNHALRFYPPFEHLKMLVLGAQNLKSVSIKFLTRRLAKHKFWHGCFDQKQGGGMIFAMATHYLDLIEWLTDSHVAPNSVTSLTTRNDIGHLAIEGSGELESGTQYSITCDGAADTELFSLVLVTHNGTEYQFCQRKGTPISMEQRLSQQDEWKTLPMQMEEHMWNSSPWQVSFQFLAAQLVESICMNERSAFMSKATDFAGYARQISLVGSHVGLS
ncbi:unnamed protein product [Penicillium pancosmium]